MAPKQMQGLRRRMGRIAYAAAGPKLAEAGPPRVKDYVHVIHDQAGGIIRIRVDALQPEGSLIGTVVGIELGAVAGVAINDLVITHIDFVYIVVRSTPEPTKDEVKSGPKKA